MHRFAFLVAGICAFVGSGCGRGGTNLQGTGASFPAPLYIKWFTDFKAANPKVTVDYQSTGSGHGVKSMIDGTVDFGASDAAMTPEEVGKIDRGVVMLPMTAGEIVLAYNLKGVKDLKLSREAYAGIFLGKITEWNDPAITKHNPKADLPETPISVVTRADSSGTSYAFSKHLSAISKAFAKDVGVSKMPNWPVGTKSKGNEGVTASLDKTPGSIGYVEYGYAKTTKLPMALLQNKKGAFVGPTTATGQAALATAKLPENLVAWVPDPPAKDAYPIVTFTWLLCYKKYDDEKKAKALKDVILYGLNEGQKSSEELGYLPLPATVVKKVRAAVDQIKAGSSKP
jgi:phosphate transport system substrate-binding protein